MVRGLTWDLSLSLPCFCFGCDSWTRRANRGTMKTNSWTFLLLAAELALVINVSRTQSSIPGLEVTDGYWRSLPPKIDRVPSFQSREERYFWGQLSSRSQDGEDKTPGSFISEFLQSLGWTFGNTVEALVRPEKAPNPDPDWKIPVVFPTCTRGSAKCYQDHQTGCGVPNRNGRIVNGNETEANEYPWMVGIHVFKGNGIRFQCGGTLINHRYVLTAAHCLEGLRASKFLLSFGDHNRTDRQGNEIQRTLSSFLIHPRFKRGSYDNDIALLKLKADLVFSKNVRPICLPLTDANYTSQIGTVVGWGRFKMGGTQPATLQDTQVPILDNAHCRKGFRYYAREITDNMFCAGYYDGRTDACMGDSGGGILLQNEENQSVIVGIISWGDGCAKEGYPGVYTRLGRFLHWIVRNTRDSCYCNT